MSKTSDQAFDIIMAADERTLRILACGLWDMLMERKMSYEPASKFVDWMRGKAARHGAQVAPTHRDHAHAGAGVRAAVRGDGEMRA